MFVYTKTNKSNNKRINHYKTLQSFTISKHEITLGHVTNLVWDIKEGYFIIT